MTKRSAKVTIREVELTNRPMRIRGYKKNGRFACRLEITAAGVAVYSGSKGNKFVANVTWEGLVEGLGKPKKK